MPHIFYSLDWTVSVFIVNAGRVLLVHHRQLKKWLPVGGHIEPNEDPVTAAHREVAEEVGLDIHLLGKRLPRKFAGTQGLVAPVYMDIHDIHGDHRHLGMIYFATAESDEVFVAEDEHFDNRWFTPQELEDPKWGVPEAIEFYAKEALASVSNP